MNHVVRKGTDVIDPTSNLLIVIPGGADGPGGVFVCSENLITWVNRDCTPVRIPIPRRPAYLAANDNEKTPNGVLIVAAAMHKLKSGFFVLAQTEEGDIFKVTMDYVAATDGSNNPVRDLKIKYFDTVPVAASLCLLKSGFLFVASEFGDHLLYQIEDLGNNDTEQIEYSSSDIKPEALSSLVSFKPRSLRNLSVVDTILSLCPLTSAEAVIASEDESPYIHALCGKGSRSSLRIVRHGLEVAQLAISELPGVPSAVWSIRKSAADEYDSYIVVSFTNATLVLSVGEIVEEVTNSVLLTSVSTIMIAQLGDDALTQIYPQGVRYIRSGRRNEWKSTEHKLIVKAACNQRQIVIALSGGELVYFELDSTGHLNEYQERRELSSEVTSLAIGLVPTGRQRSSFLAVGCADNTIRIVSLDPDNCLQLLSIQVLRWTPSSLTLSDSELGQKNPSGHSNSDPSYLHIGLTSGILMSASIDKTTGIISDSRIRYLGSKPVKLLPIKVDGSPAILALCSRPWLCLNNKSTSRYIPLIYENLDYASGFKSEQFPEAIVGISGNTLRIIMIEDVSNPFNQKIVPLEYTPRRLVLHRPTNKFVVIESEHNTYCKSELESIYSINKKEEGVNGDRTNSDNQQKKLELLPPEQFGNPRASPGKWASRINVIDPVRAEKIATEVLDNNETAFSVTTCIFQGKQDTHYVVVGIAKDVTLMPLSCSESSIAVYSLNRDGTKLELIHRTPIEKVAHALCAFQGKLLVGMGTTLRIYSMGKKRLLRKCETNKFPNCIVSIQTQGNRILVCDVQESVFYAMYKPFNNRIIIFADDTMPRWVVSSTMLDYDTICCGDKFGNISVSRLSKEISQEVDEDSTGNKFAYEKGYLHGAPHKVSRAAEFFVGETISSVSNIAMVSGGPQVILYTTFLGGIGVLIPFTYKDDVDLFQSLEMQLRSRLPPLSGRDHLSYRSYYIPVHNVIDGDLCEMYELLPLDVKTEIAGELEREVSELSRKILDMRDKFAL